MPRVPSNTLTPHVSIDMPEEPNTSPSPPPTQVGRYSVSAQRDCLSNCLHRTFMPTPDDSGCKKACKATGIFMATTAISTLTCTLAGVTSIKVAGTAGAVAGAATGAAVGALVGIGLAVASYIPTGPGDTVEGYEDVALTDVTVTSPE